VGTRLKDVAKLAGVSPKTVSNVVHGYAHVTEATRRRVQEAIEALNYRPNLSARNLRTGRTGVIALALPELDSPYFAELARFVIRAAEEHSCTVLIDQTDGLASRERLIIQGLRAHHIDGLIFSPLVLGRDDLAGRSDQTPMVLLGERVDHGPADHVAIDNVAAAHTATQHLISLGRRRIAAIGDQRQAASPTAALRMEGYARALADAGLPRDSRLITSTASYHRTDGVVAMGRLLDLDEPPDAVICFNDLLALGAMRTLHERGWRIPEDIAVVGIDDIEDGRFATPTLTTISPDKDQIARFAVSLLLSRIEGGKTRPPREVVADFTLKVRESTVGRLHVRPRTESTPGG
jgi:DNA-binding LacI/PurR family transcriptional regulator